jgi:CHAT domain-containing protein
LATGQVQLSDNAAADLLTREQEAYAARQAAQDALAKARVVQPPDPQLVADLEAQLAVADQEHATALTSIEARGDQLAVLIPGRSTVLDLAHVQALLDEQTTLISYYILGDNKTLAFIITRDTFNVVDLNVGNQQLRGTIEQFRTLDLADPTRADTHPASLQRLYEWLIAPLKPYLKTPALGIVPHGVLHYLPFAALTDGQRYLADDYVLFTLPSASALPFIQQNRKATADRVLALGDPTTTEPLPALSFAREEVEAMTGFAGAQALIGKDATETALRAQAGQAGILLLAAHGKYNRTNPLYSVIQLAGDDENDGQLEVREIYGLNLKATTDLVILSACETQLGALSAGDEVVGLNRAFLFAGTPTVVASLWAVDDEATALLMKQFYTYLREGMNKGQALRQAQSDVRGKYPHPYYWAAFVLTGDPGQITQLEATVTAEPKSDADGLWAVAVMLLGLIVLLGFGVYRHNRTRSEPKS